MAKLCSEVQNLLLEDRIFKKSRQGDGVYFQHSNGLQYCFALAGSYTHCEVFFSLRSQRANTIAQRIFNDNKDLGLNSMVFKMDLLGFNWKRLGSFCSSAEYKGEFCPNDSEVATATEIAQRIVDACSCTIDVHKYGEIFDFAKKTYNSRYIYSKYLCLIEIFLVGEEAYVQDLFNFYCDQATGEENFNLAQYQRFFSILPSYV